MLQSYGDHFKLLQKFASFRHILLANFFSSIAFWVQITATGIYISELTNSPLLIALVQFFSTFSLALVAIPFSLIVDSFNQYRFLFWVQTIMWINAFFLAICSYYFLSPVILFGSIFIMGLASAVRMPVGQASVSHTVPDNMVKFSAILNNWGFNLARSIGPLIAGILFFYTSSIFTFLAVSMIFFTPSIYFYKVSKKTALLKQPISINLLSIRVKEIKKDIQENKIFQKVSVDSFTFFFLATSIWALLPYYAHYQLDVSGKTQGFLVSLIGMG